ncbi:MAG TPA: efflux RND transporter periplasmic adaptor subunit [Devosia sp.]|jgi:macrolide-specific efflux system membrane fusion protein|uniref:efflux RND transporter periplasmic adaptor subunit n=1 Tax=Devosia sp. TaxID=1871048 RepID=UPI002DDD5F62|nr:efflux RND transporter periplasmic adaptor subunit [Devosia sp.]HEV2514406.1 efflux RND transporter periplasmic adaptor subunit [Devosia sp.]
MKRWLKWIVLVLLLGAGGAGWLVFSAPAKDEVPRTTPVARGNVEETVLASGVIQASSLVSVGAEVSGRIKSLNVQLGDDVKAGEVIAEIDSLNQENAVKAAQASLANTEAQKTIQTANLGQARTALERAEKLSPQKLISDADLQAAQLAVETAQGQLQAVEAQIQQAEINVEAAQLNLDRTKIVAPSDGTVVAVAVEVGQSVNANNSSPTIVKLANLDKMVVKAEISEADVPRVEPGQQVYFTILGDPDTRISATLRAVEPAPDSIASDDTSSSSSNAAVYYNGLFDVDNPGHKLRISMTAQVTIVLKSADDVLTVPASVLGRKGRDGSYTLEVWDQQKQAAEPKKVTIGLNNNVTAEVLDGLDEGDLVVSATAAAAAPRNGNAQGGGARNILTGGPPAGGFGRGG